MLAKIDLSSLMPFGKYLEGRGITHRKSTPIVSKANWVSYDGVSVAVVNAEGSMVRCIKVKYGKSAEYVFADTGKSMGTEVSWGMEDICVLRTKHDMGLDNWQGFLADIREGSFFAVNEYLSMYNLRPKIAGRKVYLWVAVFRPYDRQGTRIMLYNKNRYGIQFEGCQTHNKQQNWIDTDI